MVDSYVLIQSALDQVYKHTKNNFSELMMSDVCYCLSCKKRFDPLLFIIDDELVFLIDNTSVPCPDCGDKALLGDSCGYDLTPALLERMHDFWFERQVLPDDFDYSWFSPAS